MCASVLYCTFWYPTIFHQELKRLHSYDKKLETDISDGASNTYKISIILDKDENLIVTSRYREDSEDEREFVLKLSRTKHHRNGFVQYSFNKDVIPAERLEKFKDILVKDIYHLAKEFYHQHEVDIDKDAALRAVITEEEGGIDEDDNKFLINFLKNFTPVFESYARHISEINSELVAKEKVISKIEEKNKIKNKRRKYKSLTFEIAQRINQLCENACIEYTYCKTLLSSRYNKSFVHNLYLIEDDKLLEEKKEWRRCALNIRNSMRYIENIKFKNLNRLNKIAQYFLEDINIITDEVKTNTENIKLALEQGKRSEKMNYTLAFLSIYTSLVLGLSFNKLFPYNNIICTKLNLTVGSLINIIFGLGFVAFFIILLYQKYNKKNK